MKKWLFILILLISISGYAKGRIDMQEALFEAKGFLAKHACENNQLSVNDVIESKQSHLPNLYLFDVMPKGFVIVAATGQVMAYSLEDPFPKKGEVPEHIAYWTELYNDITDYYIEHPEEIPQRDSQEGKEYVEPLLTCRWNQGCYYNTSCPESDNGPCGHTLAGCVALAMAQIMHYHRLPVKGNGSITYYGSNGQLYADFGNTRYQWENMEDHLYAENAAIAQLIYHCGLGAHTNYGASISTASNETAMKAFLTYFNYPMAALMKRGNISDELWFAILKNDIDRQLPVYYSGRSSQGGHAFVCDGYDEDGLFHFNFGWGGQGNGYFTLESPMGFSSIQAIIHELMPLDEIHAQCDEHGIYYVSSDGTGDGSSWENATSNLLAAMVKCDARKQSVWVKEGVYYGSLAEYAFQICTPCKLYGGFKGNEPFNYDLTQRDPIAHPTVLDGDHIRGVFIENMILPDNVKTIVDGFVIQNGASEKGAGVWLSSSTLMRNCVFRDNQANAAGGGAYCLPARSEDAISFQNCEFYDNSATNGGGVYVGNRVSLIDCSFSNNSAIQKGGGAFTRERTSNKFWSCLFNNNTAKFGGGVYMDGNTELNNCTVVMNEAIENYGGIFDMLQPETDLSQIKNCIIWGNSSPGTFPQVGPIYSFTSCAIQDYASSSMYLSADNDGTDHLPYVRFLEVADQVGVAGHGGDWRLASNSTCINRGDSIKGQPPFDLAGQPRMQHRKVDFGAYETNTASMYIEGYICEEDPFVHQGVTYQETGTYTILYPNPVYDSLVILFIQADDYKNSHRIREICDNDYYNFFGRQLNQSGYYSEMVGCTFYELDLTVTPMPHIVITGDTVISLGQGVSLTATGAKTYRWSTGDTTATIIRYPTQDELFTVVGTNHGLCRDSTTIKVNVKDIFTDPVVYVYPNPASKTTKVFAPNILKVEVFDLYGFRRDVKWSEYEPIELDVSQYPSGVYIMYVQSLNKKKTAKLIVAH